MEQIPLNWLSIFIMGQPVKLERINPLDICRNYKEVSTAANFKGRRIRTNVYDLFIIRNVVMIKINIVFKPFFV